MHFGITSETGNNHVEVWSSDCREAAKYLACVTWARQSQSTETGYATPLQYSSGSYFAVLEWIECAVVVDYTFNARNPAVDGAGRVPGFVVRCTAFGSGNWLDEYWSQYRRWHCKRKLSMYHWTSYRQVVHATAPPFHQLVAPSTKTTTMASLTTVLHITLYRPMVLM
jgi:hypothetical protein